MLKFFPALFVLGFLLASPASAQESLSLSVTPPIIQLGIGPGEFWASSLKVVNTNPVPLTVYANVMDFTAEGEAGHGKFEPVRSGESNLLASWIEVSRDAVHVPAGGSREVPFSIRLPADAPPGGHYAAILIGTKPLDPETPTGPTVKVSSFVSSLFLVRVNGEVEERGQIREFSTERRLYDSPVVKFNLRFENSGNVHIQPQGNVAIFNMWGKKRGEILVNHASDLGQVLPKSIRKFEFEWRSEGSFFDIGKYTAVATLTFGKEAKQNVSRTIVFWIIPVRETLGVIAGFALLAGLLVFGIRRYIRRALEMEMGRRSAGLPAPRPTLKTFSRPVMEGVVDLRAIASLRPADPMTPARFLAKYRILFAVVLPLLVLAALWIFGYFSSVLTPERSFELNTGDPQISAPKP